ncbi:hypothetical protein [Roseobacter sp. S98]|uniref:hypothetical protein n=1 Tax=Roseobacter algicola (ex Choi et al. 2025) (nom. illeg.) TaxID=3092138 RepID=UPI0035C71AB5
MDQQTDQRQPLTTLRDGRLKAVVWENSNEKGDIYHSVSLAKTYEDRDGRLQDGHSFGGGELLRVAKLADKSHDVIVERRRELSLDRDQNKAPSREERQGRFQNNRSNQRSDPGLER